MPFLRTILVFTFIFLFSVPVWGRRFIIIGCPLSTEFVYGWDAERAIRLAVEEINKNGGVRLGGKRYKFKKKLSTRGKR